MYDIYTRLCTASVNLLIVFLNETFVLITKSCWFLLYIIFSGYYHMAFMQHE